MSGGTGDMSSVHENVYILPLRGQVVFPLIRGAVEISKSTFDEICHFLERTGTSCIGAVATKPTKRSEKGGHRGDLYEMGTYCRLVSHSSSASSGGKAEGQRVRMMVEGRSRMQVLEYSQDEPFRVATVRLMEENVGDEADVAVRALAQTVRESFERLLKSGQDPGRVTGPAGAGGGGQSPSLSQLLGGGGGRLNLSAAALAHVAAATLPDLTLEERQQVLECVELRPRLELVLDLLQREVEAKRMSNEINSNIQKAREAELRRMILQRQIMDVQKDLQRLQTRAQRDRGEPGEGEGQDGGEAEEETGEGEEQDEVARLSERIDKAGLPQDAANIARRELKKLKQLQPQHPEYTSTHTYLETLASLPWQNGPEARFDLKTARAVLEEDHRGLEKVKRRVLEFLAVQKMKGDMKGPILCLHGPPGIGKTSLGRSIARALGRKFHRVALGGVRDEAELRGHRRTYIGSIPGVIIQAMQNLGVNNPVILLDEVDKMSQNAMFNPQATLLEILDPEQNDSFKDHYLNTAFDLSKVLFICTANDSSLIDRPLLDRMEVIELSGYTLEEKVGIARTHLLPKQKRLHALEPERPVQGTASADTDAMPTIPLLELTDQALRALITRWTAESGVRSLERRLAEICRWAALRSQGVSVPSGAGETRDVEREEALASCGAAGSDGPLVVDERHLPHIVGVELMEPNVAERLTVGVAMGLSVSLVGGQLLFIEATRTAGCGRLTITGQLGKVMTESVETALSLLRSRFVEAFRTGNSTFGAGAGARSQVTADVLGLLRTSKVRKSQGAAKAEDIAVDMDPFKGEDLHVHFPAGGVPKDGPSAGVAVLLALTSLLLGRPMRSDTAVTGEVTLRGHVLPVGGIRDKVLAAHRAGVRHVLLPLANRRHVVEDIPASTLRDIEVHYLQHADEALRWAFADASAPGKGAPLGAPAPELVGPDLAPGVPAAAAAARFGMEPCVAVPPRSRL